MLSEDQAAKQHQLVSPGKQAVRRKLTDQSVPGISSGKAGCACGGGCAKCQSKVQAKLKVSAPRDALERQADQIADQVTGRSTGSSRPLVSSPAGRSSDETTHTISGLPSGGRSLPQRTRDYFEQRMGFDFSHVRVHDDHQAASTAQAMNARAYTSGNHVVFNRGEFRPDIESGKHLLAHELTHVVQQSQGQASDTIFRQQAQDCRQPSEEQITQMVGYITAGRDRLRAAIRSARTINSVLGLSGDDRLNQRQVGNFRRHVRWLLRVIDQLVIDLPQGRPRICISNACPGGAEACYIRTDSVMNVREHVFGSDNSIYASHILHEYVHYRQDVEFREALSQSTSPIRSGRLEDLNREYEANLAGAIFDGSELQAPTRPILGSGQFFHHEVIPPEVLNFAVNHRPGQAAEALSDLPELSGRYRSQLDRNAGEIFFRVERDGDQLFIWDMLGRRVPLNRVRDTRLLSMRAEEGFRQSSARRMAESQGLRRAFLIIYDNQQMVDRAIVGLSSNDIDFSRLR